jgi:hypothetical protein
MNKQDDFEPRKDKQSGQKIGRIYFEILPRRLKIPNSLPFSCH